MPIQADPASMGELGGVPHAGGASTGNEKLPIR